MRKSLRTGTLVGLLLAMFVTYSWSQTFPDDWDYNMDLTLNTSSTGANVSGSVSNFPVVILLTESNFSDGFTQAQADGDDIRFTLSNGTTLLSHETVDWDQSGKTAQIWVNVSTVNGNNATQSIKMYWGNASANNISSGSSVFSSANYFKGVYHLEESGNGTANEYADATGANAGQGGGASGGNGIPDQTSGLMGNANNFVASTDDNILLPAIALSGQTGSFSGWGTFTNASTTGTFSIIGRNNNDFIKAGNWTNDYIYTEINGSYTSSGTGSTYQNDTWYHFYCVYDGSNNLVKVYLNGNLIEIINNSSGNWTNEGNQWVIGARAEYSGEEIWNGKLDEVRLSTAARNSDWIKLCYENQKLGQTLVEYGTSGGSGGGSGELWSESNGNVYRETGKVGIGTDAPTAKLDVAGNIHVTGDGTTPRIGIGTSNPYSNFHIKSNNASFPYMVL